MCRLTFLFVFARLADEVEGASLGFFCKSSADCDAGEFCAVECFSKGCVQDKNVCQPCNECHEGTDEVDGTCEKCGGDDDDDESEDDGAASKIGDIAPKADRHACPHYQQMQCLLDISEKACEPDEQPLSLLEWSSQESVWLCCCPFPYMVCSKSEMNPVCLAAVGEHLSKAKVNVRSDMVAGLQKARGQMRHADEEKCSALVPEAPLSVCGFEAQPKKKRSLDRQDLFCEMVTWQWEELGDGNAQEFSANGCQMNKNAKADSGSSARKGGRLSKEEL